MALRQSAVEQARLGEPPQEGAAGGDDQLHVHAGRPDGHAVPLAGQQPGVGDVAIQAGRQHQDHHAHFVAFTAEMLARDAVAEFMDDFRYGQREHQVEGVGDVEEVLQGGELGGEHVELHAHQQEGRHPQRDGAQQGRHAEEPAHLGLHPGQDPLGIEALELDAEDVGEGLHPLLPPLFAAAFEQLPALPRHAGEDQPAAVQHAQETVQLFQRDLLRRILLLETVLDLVQAGLAVEPVEDGVFFFLKAEVGQPHGVLDHPVALPQVMVPAGHQIAPLAHRHLPGGAGNHAVEKRYHATGMLNAECGMLNEGQRCFLALMAEAAKMALSSSASFWRAAVRLGGTMPASTSKSIQ